MKEQMSNARKRVTLLLTLILASAWLAPSAFAAPVPGGTLDPMQIPKYVQPLVIPPEMPVSTTQPAVFDAAGNPVPVPAAKYNIAVRQFQQQILPGGVWNAVNGRADAFPPTPIWSYGPEEDEPPAGYVAPAPLGTAGANFNYPAFTVENTSGALTTVRWINDLVDAQGNFLPHLLTGTVDQTLHWANPTGQGCVDTGLIRPTDCATYNPTPYAGPVPIVTHVHGAHVNAESDGYPEAWWLPAANNIPAGYFTTGTLYTQYDASTGSKQDYANNVDFDPVPGSAFYSYENTQPAATLWYHDHTLGMTRLNVYAGPAGFWLVRGGAYDAPTTTGNVPAVLPGPAARGVADPNFNPAVRKTIRDIPIAIQDRSFNADGTLFYPQSRAFFDGFNGPYIGTTDANGLQTSDINPTWNPEAFFNTMVVNGTTWPQLDVAPAKYRFRLLNGSNSRFINLSMFEVVRNNTLADQIKNKRPKKKAKNDKLGQEIPFYQIGGDQGFLPNVAMIQTGSIATLPGDGTIPAPAALPSPEQALLMAPAERADVIVDFSGLPDGTVIRMINTAPDAPFGGFPDIPADPSTTGQVMQFVVNSAMTVPADATTTSPLALNMNSEPPQVAAASVTRQLSLNEEESFQVCVTVAPTGAINTVGTFNFHNPNIAADCAALGGVPQAPKAALLGAIGPDPLVANALAANPLMWKDPITETPALGATENWDFYNLTVDGHPIHMHLVRYEIIQRQLFDPLSPTFAPVGAPIPPLPNELGYKDTVLTYPGEITRVKATFDLPGLYVWHCHIVEHEDNEMMRAYYVGDKPLGFPVP